MTNTTRNTIHNWLCKLPQHDGIPRLDTWMIKSIGAEDTEYVRQVSRAFLISMIARIAEPGCNADKCLILVGPQGCGKTLALSILAGDWHVTKEFTPDDRHFFKEMQDAWLCEFELSIPPSTKMLCDFKLFLLATEDAYRAPYKRKSYVTLKRNTVFCATTTIPVSYIQSRHFWVIPCHDGINTNYLSKNRTQLFAEAKARYMAGESWLFDMEYKACDAA